jgi:competence protein ComGF
MLKSAGHVRRAAGISTRRGRFSAVFNQLIEFLQQALFLQRDVTKLKEDVASLQRELEEVNAFANRLAFELQRVSERERQEREKLVLKLENVLLHYQHVLPPPKEIKKQK